MAADERAAWSIPEWGSRYGLSRSLAYRLVQDGKGPRTATIPGTTKTIVTAEADAEYRAKLNAEAQS